MEDVTTARSLPDPQLRFSTDFRDVVRAVMPGLMQEYPGPGKLGVPPDQRFALALARTKLAFWDIADAPIAAIERTRQPETTL